MEAGPKVLSGYPDDLSQRQERIGDLGVELFWEPVTSIEHNALTFGKRRVDAHTIIWAAGVRASPAAEWLGVPADPNGRIFAGPDLSIPGYADIFAVGDTAAVRAPDGSPLTGIAPAANEEGAFVARHSRRLAGVSEQRLFDYHHEGSLAQIGKRKAVIDFGWIRLAVQSPGGCGGAHTSPFSWECALASASHSTGCGSSCATSEAPGSLRKQYASRPSIDGPLSFLSP